MIFQLVEALILLLRFLQQLAQHLDLLIDGDGIQAEILLRGPAEILSTPAHFLIEAARIIGRTAEHVLGRRMLGDEKLLSERVDLHLRGIGWPAGFNIFFRRRLCELRPLHDRLRYRAAGKIGQLRDSLQKVLHRRAIVRRRGCE